MDDASRQDLETGAPGPISIAIAATFTAEPLEASLRFWMDKLGFSPKIAFAPYNQVFQQLLDPTSLLSNNQGGINLILVRIQDWDRSEDSGSANGGMGKSPSVSRAKIEKNVQDLIRALKSVAQRLASPLVLCLCPAMTNGDGSQFLPFFRQMEDLIADELGDIDGLNIVTSSEAAATYPVSECHDSEGDKLGHIPYTTLFFTSLGTLIARKIHALRSSPYKVIVLDCDHTLWKGVCGEDGASGIEIDSPRSALQQFMVAQHDAGMLLCLCSKNNEEDVREVFELHADMPLTLDHVLSSRINWKPKSENIRELSRELQLGLDSFIFIDDDPVECAEVQARCAPVLTLQLPREPGKIPKFLEHVWAFDHLKVTQEDTQRTALYKQNLEREHFRGEFLSLDDFLASLALRVQISELSSHLFVEHPQLRRVAQLTQRTNQFNCTSRRRSEEEIRNLCQTQGLRCLVVEVQDRFGDYGLVGVIMYRVGADALEVDTFLLSCRALGRGVEHRMLAGLGEIASQRGLARVDVAFAASKQNQPALDFLTSVGKQFKQPVNDAFIFRFPVNFAATLSFNQSVTKLPASNLPVQESTASVSGTDHLRTRAAEKAALLSWIATISDDVERVLKHIESQVSRPRPELEIAFTPAGTPDEKILAEIWAEVLGVKQVGIYDNFFQLGGDSFLAVRLLSRVRARFEVELPVSGLFEHPTIDGMAVAITQIRIGQEDPGMIAQALTNLEQLSNDEVEEIASQEGLAWTSGQRSSATLRQVDLTATIHGSPSSNGHLYRCDDISRFRAGDGLELVYCKRGNSVRVLPSLVVEVLDRCRDFKPLDGHVRDICRDLKLGREQFEFISERLAELVEGGYLVSRRELLEPYLHSGHENNGVEISTIGMATCDRLKILERGLVSYIESARKYDRSSEIAIVDNSGESQTRNSYRQMLRSLKVRYGARIFYAGLEEKTRFADRLTKSGDLPPEVVMFGLFGLQGEALAAFGGNRNALLLHTVGEAVFTADDDTVCRVSAAPELSDGLRFSSGCDPLEYRVFSDRDGALQNAPSVEIDILAIHEKLLGKKLDSIISGFDGGTAVELDRMDSDFLRRLESGSGKVLATINGVVGDCAWGSPFGCWGGPMGYLLFEGRSYERLVESESVYRAACTSREIFRVVNRPTISDGTCSVATSIGLDNRELLPPYTPLGRGLDILFGINLWKCFEDGYLGHVPYALLHAPVENRRFWRGEIFRSASGYDIDKLMIDCIKSFEFGPSKADEKERLRALGRYLMELGSMPIRDFQEFLRVQAWRTISVFIDLMEDRLLNCGGSPEFWANDVRRYIEILRESASRKDYCIPLDLMQQRSAGEARELSQRFVFKFGELLYWWANMVEVAKALKANGQRLACPI